MTTASQQIPRILWNTKVHYHFFYVHGSMHCELLSIIVQQDATVYTFCYISADSSTCFG